MKNNEKRITCAKARETDMVDYLANQGFQPTKIKGYNWDPSPLRQEKTASLKVERKLNRWYNFGTGKSGNLIDFAILYSNCTIAEFLQSIEGNLSFDKPKSLGQSSTLDNEGAIKIISSKPLHSLALLQYLKCRHISIKMTGIYCSETTFELYNKTYYSIGFRNDLVGYELLNQWYKNGSSPKAIKTIKNGAKKVAVFEVFFDFLSFLVLTNKQQHNAWDFCILNPLSFFEKAQPFVMQYSSIHLFLDNDAAGQNCSASALKMDEKYINESGLYRNYKDLNEWVCLIGKQSKNDINEHPP